MGQEGVWVDHGAIESGVRRRQRSFIIMTISQRFPLADVATSDSIH
jgi:hypothetical protein